MKKKLGIICLGALLLAGCGTPKLENGKEAVITFKDDAKISVDDLYTRLKDEYGLNALISMIDTYILEKEFADYVATAKTSAENTVKSALADYESEDQFLQILQQYYGFSTIDAYQDAVYMSYLQNHAMEEYAKILVTDKDIENYYKKTAKGDVEISHILITADVTSEMTTDEQTKAEDDAKAKAESLLKELKDAEDVAAKFKELVKANTKDEATIDKDGAIGKINYLDFPDGTYDELLDAAYKTKDGEVYSKVVKAEDGYHIVYRTKSYELDTLDNLKDKIRTYLAKDIQTNSDTLSIDTLEYYRKEYDLKITDSELNKQYDNYIKRVYASLNNQENNQDTEE